MPSKNSHELIPSAKRLIHSLRDLGYEFAPAVADLVDNSIEAGASKVDIQIQFAGENSWVRISDNGSGMSASSLREAMRYGSSSRDYGDDDLGKFGLGLKTASMSQCRTLTVSSKPGGTGAVSSFSWDLDHIAKSDEWEVLTVLKNDLPQPIRQSLDDGYHTVVLWEKLDRVLDYKYPDGEAARKFVLSLTRQTEDHLAMVFHRFLSGEARKRRLQIRLNGNLVEPWDPFCRNEKRTRPLKACSVPITHEGQTGEVHFEPYVLPHQNRFSSADAHERASGPEKWNKQQGFYIYRGDRLIQSGGWSNMRTLDEHHKLARVALMFGPKLDDAFKINVAKMRVQLPAQLRTALEKLLVPVIAAANSEYREGGGGKAPAASSTPPSLSPSPSQPAAVVSPASTKSEAKWNDSEPRPVIKSLHTIDEVKQRLLAVADAEEKPVLERLFERLEQGDQQ